MPNCLELSDVCVKRGRHVILSIDHVSVGLQEFVGLVGPNGAGKTTFLKLCCGLIRPARGTVVFENQRISQLARWNVGWRRHIGYIPQQTEYNAHLPFTVREIVVMGRAAQRSLGRQLGSSDYEKADFWLDQMGLYERRTQTFRSLSGGQQQRALIARAMVGEPRVVLMDEPGAGLDAPAKRQLAETLERLFNENDLTVLIVSHELAVIPQACRRLVLMHEGRVLADGATVDVLQSEPMRQLFAAGPLGSAN